MGRSGGRVQMPDEPVVVMLVSQRVFSRCSCRTFADVFPLHLLLTSERKEERGKDSAAGTRSRCEQRQRQGKRGRGCSQPTAANGRIGWQKRIDECSDEPAVRVGAERQTQHQHQQRHKSLQRAARFHQQQQQQHHKQQTLHVSKTISHPTPAAGITTTASTRVERERNCGADQRQEIAAIF